MSKQNPDPPALSNAYNAIINEINRYRDWPIRVLTFTSALHFALIGAFSSKTFSLANARGSCSRRFWSFWVFGRSTIFSKVTGTTWMRGKLRHVYSRQ